MGDSVQRISFDLDGVLANFTRGFTRIAHNLFGTPVGDEQSQQTWYFEQFPELELTPEQCEWKNGPIWNWIRRDPDFWANLDPFNVSVMQRINSIQNKVFITNRLGVDPKGQSIRFLEKWGVQNPAVVVAADKEPIVRQYNVVAHIDDYFKNTVDLRFAVPYNAVFWTPFNMVHHAEAKALGAEIVLSVDHFIDECDRRGLTRY